jgi:hypothetical protein
MRPIQIESWALDIIDRVNSKNPVEDFHVELKSEWIDPQKAARRIAGHANAARGEPILWLIGVDEDNGVKGANHEELASWFPSVQAEFDGVVPSMIDLTIPTNGTTIVALYFETDRAPYVIKNPLFGKENGGSISHEIPWREGTRIRSARRSDLIKMLIPIMYLPEIDILNGELSLSIYQQGNWNWNLVIETYITPQIGYPCVFPFHQCEASFEIVNLIEKTSFHDIKLVAPYSELYSWSINSSKHESDSLTIRNTRYEAIIEGPGRLNISGVGESESKNINFDSSVAKLKVIIRMSHSDKVIQLNETLFCQIPDKNQIGKGGINKST